MVGLDLNTIRHALSLARKHGYTEVHLKSSDIDFSAKLSPKARSKAMKASEASAQEIPDAEVTSPCVGIFKPLAKPIKVGHEIRTGDLIGQVMALGLTNDIESSIGGEITEFLVKEGDPVQYGQVIAKVKVGG